MKTSIKALFFTLFLVMGIPTLKAQVDYTDHITNPSFETGDMREWTIYVEGNVVEPGGELNAWSVNDRPLDNADGNYVMNWYAWTWTWNEEMDAIVQTIQGMPAGRYELTALLCSWKDWEVTLDVNGNSQSKTMTADNDHTGERFSLKFDLNSTQDMVITTSVVHVGYNQWAPSFFKADDFHLYYYGQSLSDIALPLPNDNTTQLVSDRWYYYDAPATGKYTLTGNLLGLCYCTGEAYTNKYEANPTKSEMGFPAGRVFFKTIRNDATLKVEPANTMTSFTAATLNADGLPLTLTFYSVYTQDINPDGPGPNGTKLISSYIANRQIDMLAFQEDFNYDSELKSNMNDYSFGTHRASVTSNVIDASNRPVDTDGLQFATRNAVASFSNEGITQFSSSHSEDVINVSLLNQDVDIKDGNSLIKKGYRYYEVTMGGEKIDVYITHADAGTTDQSNTDPYVVSRENQLKQIANAIIAKGNTDRPKIFMGDTNCRWTREDIKANFFDILTANYDVSDVWVELRNNNEYPLPGQSTINEEVVDKIIYINPKGNNVMKLTPISYERDAANYVNSSGNPLGDHAPVVVKFGLGLYEEVNNTLILGDINKDGQISIADVTALVNIILGKDNTLPYQYDHVAADVNQDGGISIADVTALVNIILGK